MSETYIVLIAETETGELKTALVEKATFEDEPNPADYFRAGMKSTEKSGEVEITGDTHLLPGWISEA